LHAMLAVDADNGAVLGLVGGQVVTGQGDIDTPHAKRALTAKESGRWVATAEQAKEVLAEADTITVVDDREGDFYAHWSHTPATVQVSVVELREPRPPKHAEPVHWILLTTHAIKTLDQAWQIVRWYQQRWIIEQFFRTLKLQGLRIEDSQLATADRLCKLVAI